MRLSTYFGGGRRFLKRVPGDQRPEIGDRRAPQAYPVAHYGECPYGTSYWREVDDDDDNNVRVHTGPQVRFDLDQFSPTHLPGVTGQCEDEKMRIFNARGSG